jgi:prepilin signal peptidase PulO-like enzyme (type II secretory pathway)
MPLVLFILGTALGSFLNVVALRYDPEKFVFHRRVVGGRSRCPQCGKELRWYELLPILSFILQAGRCRSCGARLGFQYPVVEILAGLIFVLVPRGLENYFSLFPLSYLRPAAYYLFAALWIIAFLILLLISLIDFRLRIIPDELSLLLVALGIILAFLVAPQFGEINLSFVKSYSFLFGLRENIWLNRSAAAAFGAALPGFLILITRGRGMGWGDVKLGFALGALFGWPEIVLILIFGFVFGSLVGIAAIIAKRKTLKSFVPFGPFLAAAAAFVFFLGYEAADFYFRLFNL